MGSASPGFPAAKRSDPCENASARPNIAQTVEPINEWSRFPNISQFMKCILLATIKQWLRIQIGAAVVKKKPLGDNKPVRNPGLKPRVFLG
jgi:hypothetical protein